MLIMLCVISALILGSGIFICLKYGNKLYRNDQEWVYMVLIAAGVVLLVINIVATFAVGATYSEHIVIDDKIELYKNENAKIEQQMSLFVSDYMDYESDTFEKLKGEDLVTLITMFPELNSNELVKKQIDVYVSNNAEIKRLESERLQYRLYAWWLFFG